MGGVVSGITDAIGITDSDAGEDAAQASKQAASTQAKYQREALDYLKEQQALPTELRDQALQQYGNIFLEGGGLQGPSMQDVQSNPLYGAIMGTQEDAEQAVLRNQAATGGFRSGATQTGLASTAADIQRNALLTGYQDESTRQQQNIAGLQGLAQLPTGAGNIANLTSGIGQTLAQGQTAAANAQMAGSAQNQQAMMSMANLAATAAMFSDVRLKKNIKRTGEQNGFPTFEWEWNEAANKLGLFGKAYGTISKYVKEKMPEAVSGRDGYETVNYEMIEVSHGNG